MFKNWQTTAGGVSGLLGIGAAIFHAIQVGQFPDPSQIAVMWGVVSVAIAALRAKDQNVTGGTVPQTTEAARRTGTPLT